MSESDFYTPTDLDLLRMENELLAFEVRFLKAHLAGPARGVGSMSMNRLAHLEEAERDLTLLLERMGSSSFGPLFRLSGSFRTLEERYVRSRITLDSLPPSQRVAYLEGAERDLVLLLRRIGRSSLGPLFRRRKNFRTLERRYL